MAQDCSPRWMPSLATARAQISAYQPPWICTPATHATAFARSDFVSGLATATHERATCCDLGHDRTPSQRAHLSACLRIAQRLVLRHERSSSTGSRRQPRWGPKLCRPSML